MTTFDFDFIKRVLDPSTTAGMVVGSDNADFKLTGFSVSHVHRVLSYPLACANASAATATLLWMHAAAVPPSFIDGVGGKFIRVHGDRRKVPATSRLAFLPYQTKLITPVACDELLFTI
jgi:hypothetical protein